MARTSQQIYAEQLMPYVNGHPLWFPEPGDQMPTDAHREAGVVPGDVGYLTRDGDFIYLFHAFGGPGAPRQGNPNLWGTPADFHPFPVPAGDNIPPMIKRLSPYTEDTFVSSMTGKSADISWTNDIVDPTR